VYDDDRAVAEAAVIEDANCEFWRCLIRRSNGLSTLAVGVLFDCVGGRVETGGLANSPASKSWDVKSALARSKTVFIPKILNSI
jgi:hypothetical protein